jgi:hypothetical protein
LSLPSPRGRLRCADRLRRPRKRKYVTQVTYGFGAASYISDNRRTRWEHVMTWTSDRTGFVFYTVLAMLIVLSSIYIPA